MISFVLPTMGRPKKFERFVNSVRRTSTEPVQIIAALDRQDESVYPEMKNVIYRTFTTRRMGIMFGEIMHLAAGDLVGLAGDDFIMRTDKWNEIVREAVPEDQICCFGFKDGGGINMASAPMVTRRWLDLVMVYCDPEMWADTLDKSLKETAEMVKRFIYLDEVYLEHMHYSFGKSEKDWVYEKRRGISDIDNTRYKSAEGKYIRQENARRLRAVLDV